MITDTMLKFTLEFDFIGLEVPGNTVVLCRKAWRDLKQTNGISFIVIRMRKTLRNTKLGRTWKECL